MLLGAGESGKVCLVMLHSPPIHSFMAILANQYPEVNPFEANEAHLSRKLQRLRTGSLQGHRLFQHNSVHEVLSLSLKLYVC